MLPQVFEEASTSEAPPATGGSTPAPASAGSDVNWVEESRPAHEEPSEAPPKGPVATPATAPVPSTPSQIPPPLSATPPQAQPPVTPAGAPTATPPVAPPAQPAAAAEPQAPAQPAAPPVDRAKLRENEIGRLTSAYAMNVEEAQQVLTQPEIALPKLMANLHVSVVDALIPAIMQNMPAVVHQIMQAGNVHKEAEDTFYKAWPVLRDTKYEPTVVSAIKMYRHLNPTASREEAVRAAGLSAMISLRLPIPQEMLSAPAPSAPQVPAASFTPAAPGSSHAAPPAPPQNQNPYTLLNQELDETDGIVRK